MFIDNKQSANNCGMQMSERRLTSRMKLNELHVLIGKPGPRQQRTAITGARVSRCAREIATTKATTNSDTHSTCQQIDKLI